MDVLEREVRLHKEGEPIPAETGQDKYNGGVQAIIYAVLISDSERVLVANSLMTLALPCLPRIKSYSK